MRRRVERVPCAFPVSKAATLTALLLAVASVHSTPAGDASAPAQATESPAQVIASPVTAPMLRVEYSLEGLSSRMREVPKEVLLVTRETTGRAVGAQVAMNVVFLAAFGGASIQGFSKDDLRGGPMPDVKDHAKVKNPVADEFVASLQKKLDAEARARYSGTGKIFNRPVVVSDGHARLVYEELAGSEEERYRLKMGIEIHKIAETAGLLSFRQPWRTSCGHVSSEAMPLKEWAKDDYEPVRKQVADILSACEERLLREVPHMLKH